MAPIWHKLAQIVLLVILFRFLWKAVQASVRAATEYLAATSDENLRDRKRMGAVLEVLSSTAPGTATEASTYRVFDRVVTIGRGSDNDVVLNDPFVSLQHARLVWKRNSYYLEDVNSTNHTYVNGKIVKSPLRLREGDRIELGETILRFSYRTLGDSARVTGIES